jgi:U3 small nucleolar RNA-associated protein 23
MGRKKNKWFKKVVSFYRYVFKFEVPYNILIDGNFVAMSLKKKFEMKDILAKTMDENVHLVIPSCVLNEIKEIGDKIPGIVDAVSKYKIEECQHGQILSPDNCIKSYIGKKNFKKYFVATQDSFLRQQLRKIPGVPLLFFDQNMILIDKPSQASVLASKKREELKEEPKKFEKKELKEKEKEIKQWVKDEYKKTDHYKNKAEQYKINKLMGRIRKKAKGPNPLSCKKKMKNVPQNPNNNNNIQTNNNNNNNNNNNISS